MKSQLLKLLILSIIYGLIALFILLYTMLIQRGYGVPCFFQETFGISCPSCGATRSFYSLMHMDFSAAISFNPIFTLVIYPFTAFLIIQDYIITVVNVVRHTKYQSLASFIWQSLQLKKEQ